ncbi:beta-glucan synthesis-associated [Pyrrhoderma noxium]|uniref:Beta-glucan synthesis-associated n=1 Tax=Pyrrhoderma noxium TaxID=2282107 RepID=A0A286UX02_9AGAM|nr:beta-glucan synthesis-associated [Pyrrhoderma noxium]
MDSASLRSTNSFTSDENLVTQRYGETPYGQRSYANSHVSDQYSLAPDPTQWGAILSPSLKEDDDSLHAPDPRTMKRGQPIEFSRRGIENLGCLALLLIALVGLFAGYPLISYFTKPHLSRLGGFNIGGTNASGQIADIGNYGLIDKDTPQEVYTKTGWEDGSEMELVFSDEFNVEGRTFYPGDDPYWEASDLWYGVTADLEWYDPSAITTKDGYLQITMSKKDTHELQYQSGQMTSWNKFCFTGGYIEVNVSLPGFSDVSGFWPAVWTMGNLGRAGYSASTDGTWPYTYDFCDVGTLANQTKDGLPENALIQGDNSRGGQLSVLPGQRLSRCTCTGESHPGPMHEDGTYVGRGAPEIDIFEAQITITDDVGIGEVSQSAQWAPFNFGYEWFNTSENLIIADSAISQQNSYTGSAIQQATSIVTKTDQNCYTSETGCFSIYGFEYKPGFDDAYITWISDNKVAWTAKAGGFAADSRVEIHDRPIPQEPMYIIMNFGMSPGFQFVDFANLPFPATMLIDYVRVYQPKGSKNIGCDPPDFPTAKYINTYIDAYTNPNLTSWSNISTFPKNNLIDQC